MNRSGEPGAIDNSLFDLLVDGELAESERRELLTRLDDCPDGWRRCALAFLESQCWRQGFEAFRERTETKVQAARSKGDRASQGIGPATLLAMAASFLAALILGILLRGTVVDDASREIAPQDFAASNDPVQPSPTSPFRETPATNLPLSAPADGLEQYVAIPVRRMDGSRESIRLPVVPREAGNEAWLDELPTAVPSDLVQALVRSGHEVRQKRRLLPLRMRDGRSVVVPYDQIEVRSLGGSAYQ